MTTKCPLCFNTENKYRIVRETTHSYAMINKSPIHPSHLLILPKRHVSEFADLPGDEIKDLMSLVTYFGKLVVEKFNLPTMSVQNYGAHRSQDHLHVHVLCSENGLRKLMTGKNEYPLFTKEQLQSDAQELQK